MNSDYKIKPPLGLCTRKISEENYRVNRVKDIVEAMLRYLQANMEIPEEWATELVDLRKEFK